MSENVFHDQTIEQNPDLTDTDRFLLKNLNSKEIDGGRVKALAKDLIKKLEGMAASDHDKVTAVALRFLYEDMLTPTQRETLDQLTFKARDEVPTVNSLFEAMGTIDQETEDYFDNPQGENRIISARNMSDPLASALLNIKCYIKAQQMQSEFEKNNKRGYIAEPFKNPQTSMWSIWMSAQGQHYDPLRIQV